MKADVDPMRPAQRLQDAPRCCAHSKRTGLPCKAPAVRGWKVCRMHGARGGAKPGPAHPSYRHGGRSQETVRLRAMVAEMTKESRKLREALGSCGHRHTQAARAGRGNR